TVDANGLVTAVAAGSTNISATLGSISNSTSLTVTAPTISSISVTPVGLTLGIGINQQYTATATYSDGSSQDLVNGVTWSSSTTSVATVNNYGLVTTVGAGTTTITATVGSFSDSSTLTVVAAHLLSIAVSPATPSIAVGTTQQFSAVGTFDDGSTATNLSGLSWKSSKPNIASIRSSGLAHGKKSGAVTISATASGLTGTATLTVGTGTLVSLAITPATP